MKRIPVVRKVPFILNDNTFSMKLMSVSPKEISKARIVITPVTK